jgi:hypothetical protein
MKIVKCILSLAFLALTVGSCKKSSFVSVNSDPNTLYKVDPADQFLAAASGCQDDFEYYYDVYRALNYWLQYSTNQTGNALGFMNPSSNFNERYAKIFYGRVGSYLSDIPHLVANMTEDEQAKRVYQVSIAAIFKAYYAFYVSDINGSIPYSEAFQARYGGTLYPKYDRQQDLFDTLDLQIKNAVHTLETSQPVTQTLYDAKDPFYGTAADQVKEWIAAGNALRLKIALRLMKQDPAKLQAIATEVVADPNQMSDNSDGWVLLVGPNFANATGNYNPVGFAASKPLIDFMSAKGDPRLRIFYTTNTAGNYLGSFPSPDDATDPANAVLYSKAADTFSVIQPRLFAPNYAYTGGPNAAVVGTGNGFFPILTYAEYCFIRADLAARNITTDNAEDWYNKGITASIQFYNTRAIDADILTDAIGLTGYVPVTQSEIDAYLLKPDIAYDPAKALDQIACQAYLEFYRQPSEAWAWWKRTGYPNTTSVVPWSDLKGNGNELVMPRRALLVLKFPSDANYDNQKAAYDEMATNPDFGSGPGDVYGRVWWDKK